MLPCASALSPCSIIRSLRVRASLVTAGAAGGGDGVTTAICCFGSVFGGSGSGGAAAGGAGIGVGMVVAPEGWGKLGTISAFSGRCGRTSVSAGGAAGAGSLSATFGGSTAGARRLTCATSSALLASARIWPSTVKTETASSERPETPFGTTTFSAGKPISGTDHTPGATAWPSDSTTVAGKPRMRT